MQQPPRPGLSNGRECPVCCKAFFILKNTFCFQGIRTNFDKFFGDTKFFRSIFAAQNFFNVFCSG